MIGIVTLMSCPIARSQLTTVQWPLRAFGILGRRRWRRFHSDLIRVPLTTAVCAAVDHDSGPWATDDEERRTELRKYGCLP
jgi:hypothetical protein